jgi:hypothetical protein
VVHSVFKSNDLLFSCAQLAAGKDTDISTQGIVQGHAYSLLQCVEESDTNGSYQLVQLRNPWGQTEWKGRFSDADTASWTRRLRNKLNYDPDKSGDDGTFWMLWNDFVANYEYVFI